MERQLAEFGRELRQVRAAIGGLDEMGNPYVVPQGLLVGLRKQGLSVREIGRRTGLSKSQVHRRLGLEP
jgi:hypothetical protein